MMTKFINNSKPLPDYIEKYIISLINIKPPLSYTSIDDTEVNNIILQTKNKYKNFSAQINKNLVFSIRSSFMKNYMIIHHKNIQINSTNIINDYNNKINILEICKKYDISPLNIIRFIFDNKYSNKLTFIIKNTNLLNNYDLKQLNIAICNDTFALINQSTIHSESLLFENIIEKFLIKNNIKFKTQEQLVDEQTKLYGKPTVTPDFLILSDFFINNIKINWIDAKNFYGSNIYFVKKSIEKQIQKYINNYGYGCIIFKLGFNDKLIFKNVILLDNNFIS